MLDPGTLQLHTPKNASRELIFPTATIARRVTQKGRTLHVTDPSNVSELNCNTIEKRTTEQDRPQPTPTMPSPAKVTVLISGSGSNLQALINASTSSTPPTLPNVTFTRVISDRASAYGLQRATAAGIPTSTLGILPYKKRFPDPSGTPAFQSAREAYDADLAALVLQDNPDMVVCAGFMR